MPDAVVRIYLHVLIIGSVIFPVLWMIIWAVKRRQLIHKRYLIRDLFFLMAGLLGFYMFSARLLNNWLIMGLMSVLLIASVYLTEGVIKLLWKPRRKQRRAS